jgi:hypothetical protein
LEAIREGRRAQALHTPIEHPRPPGANLNQFSHKRMPPASKRRMCAATQGGRESFLAQPGTKLPHGRTAEKTPDAVAPERCSGPAAAPLGAITPSRSSYHRITPIPTPLVIRSPSDRLFLIRQVASFRRTPRFQAECRRQLDQESCDLPCPILRGDPHVLSVDVKETTTP